MMIGSESFTQRLLIRFDSGPGHKYVVALRKQSAEESVGSTTLRTSHPQLNQVA